MLLGGDLWLVGVWAGELRVGCRLWARVSPGCHLVGAGYGVGGKTILHHTSITFMVT